MPHIRDSLTASYNVQLNLFLLYGAPGNGKKQQREACGCLETGSTHESLTPGGSETRVTVNNNAIVVLFLLVFWTDTVFFTHILHLKRKVTESQWSRLFNIKVSKRVYCIANYIHKG